MVTQIIANTISPFPSLLGKAGMGFFIVRMGPGEVR